MRSIIILSVLMYGTVAFAAEPLETRAKNVSDDNEKLQVANLFLEAGKKDRAKSLYLSISPNSSFKKEADFGLSQLINDENNQRKSKKACTKLEKNYPKSFLSEICFGNLWIIHRRPARSVDFFKEAIKKGADYRGALGLADTYALMGELENAKKEYENVLKQEQSYAGYLGLAIVYERLGKNSKAIENAKKAVQLEGDSAKANYHLGRLMGSDLKAVSFLQKAVKLNPQWSLAHATLGSALLLQKQAKAALVEFERADELEPDRGTYHLGMGKSYYLLKNYDKAKEQLEITLELVPNIAEAKMLLARVESKSGNSFDAANLAAKAVGLSPDDVNVSMDAARLFYDLGRFTRANSYFLKVIALDSKNSEAYEFLGDIACERKMYPEGKKYYQSALAGSLKNSDKKVLNNKIKKCKSR